MKVHIALTLIGDEVAFCKVLPTEEEALDEALAQANSMVSFQSKDWIEENPEAIDLPDSNTMKMLLQTNLYSVMVISSPIGISDDIDVSEPEDEAFHPDMPIGWSIYNKPMTVKDFTDDPFLLCDPELLSDKEQAALVYARLAKRPNYKVLPLNMSKDNLLLHIKKMDSYGKVYIKEEIDLICLFVELYLW